MGDIFEAIADNGYDRLKVPLIQALIDCTTGVTEGTRPLHGEKQTLEIPDFFSSAIVSSLKCLIPPNLILT